MITVDNMTCELCIKLERTELRKLYLLSHSLTRLMDEDFRKAEDFINLMRVLYMSTFCVSTEKNPACGQILPVLQELEMHFAAEEGDTVFVSNFKKQVWANLSKR